MKTTQWRKLNQIKLQSLLLLILLFSCINSNKVSEARLNADLIILRMESGNINNYFPSKYFQKEQIIHVVDLLNNQCDFATRKGGFKNDFYQVVQGQKEVSFIYEYYLKCDSLRLIFTYNINDKVELSGFKVEQMKDENFMVRDKF